MAQLFEPPLPTPSIIGVSQFRELQLNDPQVSALRNIAVDESLCQNEGGVVFYEKCGVLFKEVETSC